MAVTTSTPQITRADQLYNRYTEEQVERPREFLHGIHEFDSKAAALEAQLLEAKPKNPRAPEVDR